MHPIRLPSATRSTVQSVAGSWLVPSHSRRSLSSGASNRQDCDVVVVGGGPAGLAFANALVAHRPIRESLRVALVEAGDLGRVRQWTQSKSFSNRVSSITNASTKFLHDIGAWDFVEETRTMPIEEMQVWDGLSDSRIFFRASEAGISEAATKSIQMARLTENLNLQQGLLRSIDKLGVVDVMDNVKVSSIEKDSENGGWPLVHLSNGLTLRARLLVGADGNNSPVRSYAKIRTYGWAYNTRAIVATLFHSRRDSNSTAYQRFLPTGPIAFLPLSETTSSLVWSTKPEICAMLTTAAPHVLSYMINAAFRLPEVSLRYLYDVILDNPNITPETILEEIRWRERAHSIQPHSAFCCTFNDIGVLPEDEAMLPPPVISIQEGSVASFPLRMAHADSYIGEEEHGSRTVLLGDAAHTIHPLAGQGLNMGLMDASVLARCINSSVLVGSDIGSHTALLPYGRQRYLDNHKLLSTTDKLHKLYSSTNPLLVWARSVGLEVVNELDTLKTALMVTAGAKASLSLNFWTCDP